MMHQKFRVAPGKITGWKRLVGQEVPIDAYTDLQTISGSSIWNASHANLVLNGTTTAAPISPVNAVVTSRELSSIVSGPQTPQASQPALDMWIPFR
jgi:hypothetical protein